MEIDIELNMNEASNGSRKTLNKYNVFLWSRLIKNTRDFQLRTTESKSCDVICEGYPRTYKFVCDSILPDYSNNELVKHIINKIDAKTAVDLSNVGSTIGGYMLYPTGFNSKKPDINESRLLNPKILGRFDLTLECIRRWYMHRKSPLYDDIERYSDFFDLFLTFKEYADYFLLRDMLDKNYRVVFWTPFNRFKGSPLFKDDQEYKGYVNAANNFIRKRNERILKLAKKKQTGERSNAELESIQEKFHQLILETAADYGRYEFLNRRNKNLPKIQYRNYGKRMWFPILGMHGGLSYYLRKKEGQSVLFVVSWNRVIGGSEAEYLITSDSTEEITEG